MRPIITEGPVVFLILFWTSLMARSLISQSTPMILSPTVLLFRLLSSLAICQRKPNIFYFLMSLLSTGIETTGGIFTPPIKHNTMALTKCSEIFSIYSVNQSGVLIHVYESMHGHTQG